MNLNNTINIILSKYFKDFNFAHTYRHYKKLFKIDKKYKLKIKKNKKNQFKYKLNLLNSFYSYNYSYISKYIYYNVYKSKYMKQIFIDKNNTFNTVILYYNKIFIKKKNRKKV
ncbi:hypothetical protein BcabD6B2_58820 (apicoplast) [Babesia caballi]|uniref:Ribosomal protein S17 n=1 Tax=Babesia caballi TaxID=5871 RepID=A0AAV4M2K9_BABCB|nr:hypothetical protein BcabD6B2_58820 [Babesia caballi]